MFLIFVVCNAVCGLLQKTAVLLKNSSTASARLKFECAKILFNENIRNLSRIAFKNNKKESVLNRYSCHSVTFPPKGTKSFTYFVYRNFLITVFLCVLLCFSVKISLLFFIHYCV